MIKESIAYSHKKFYAVVKRRNVVQEKDICKDRWSSSWKFSCKRRGSFRRRIAVAKPVPNGAGNLFFFPEVHERLELLLDTPSARGRHPFPAAGSDFRERDKLMSEVTILSVTIPVWQRITVNNFPTRKASNPTTLHPKKNAAPETTFYQMIQFIRKWLLG